MTRCALQCVAAAILLAVPPAPYPLAACTLSQARTEIEGAETDEARQLDDALATLEPEIIDEPYRYSRIVLLGQFHYLYVNFDGAAPGPGRHAITRHEELAEQLDGLMEDLDRGAHVSAPL